jgi:glycosyltransferase involved in cell wall biosynthesis
MSQSPASDPLRIVGVTKTFPTAARPNAAGFFLRDLNALAERGHSVELAAASSLLSRGAPADLLDPRIQLVPRRHLSLSQFGPLGPAMSRLSLWTAMRALAPAVRELTDGADALYAKFMTMAPILRHARPGVRRVISIGEGVDSVRYRLRRIAHKDLVSGLAEADAVEVRNREVAEILADGYCDSSALHVVPSGVDTARFVAGSRELARRELGLQPGTLVVSHVGARNRNKGGDRVLQACAALGRGDCVVMLAGQGWEGPAAPTQRLLGSIPPSSVLLMLQASDIFVFPSISEGMPNALLEALSCGLPCVAADAGWATFLRNGTDCLKVDPEDVPAIAEAIRLLADDDVARDRLGLAGRSTAERHSLASRIDALESLLRRRQGANAVPRVSPGATAG